MEVELFYSPYCRHCETARQQMSASLSNLVGSGIIYRERNLIDDIERAVEVGVTTTPTLVIDGKIVAVGRWRNAWLRQRLVTAVQAGD